MEWEKNAACPCRRVECPRHGDCAACKEHHHSSPRKPLTRCEKLARKEQRKAERQGRGLSKSCRPAPFELYAWYCC